MNDDIICGNKFSLKGSGPPSWKNISLLVEGEYERWQRNLQVLSIKRASRARWWLLRSLTVAAPSGLDLGPLQGFSAGDLRVLCL